MPDALIPPQEAVNPVKLIIDEFLDYKSAFTPSTYASARAPKGEVKKMNEYAAILQEKNVRIRALQIDLHEYSGCFKQGDLVLIINRVAKENNLPRFAPSSGQLTKTQFANLLTNYLYSVTAKEEVDRFVE
jgi:hypothetical protein